MSFRTSENLQRYEFVRFHLDNVIEQPANAAAQKKTGYRFTINDRSTMFDFFNGYFEVSKELQKIADGLGYAAADRATIINGSHSLIRHMVIKSSGKIVYESDNLHRITNVKNILEYSDDYSRSVAKNSFWYIDTDRTTADTNNGFDARKLLTQRVGEVDNPVQTAAKSINEIIPLNRYSFFQELERKMLPPMQLTIELTLNEDSELIHKAAAADAGRVVVKRLYLWLPRLVPKDSMYSSFVSEFLKPTTWTYMRDLYNQSANTRAIQNMFQISPAIDNVKHVFIYLQRTDGPNNNESERTPYILDTFQLDANSSLSSCRLEYGNNVFYPELEYDGDSKIRIFNDLMSYAFRKNDYNTGTQLNLHNFTALYGLLYFDLSYQKEDITRDPKQLILHYRLNVAPAVNVRAHSIVFYESEVIVKTVGNELMIV